MGERFRQFSDNVAFREKGLDRVCD